MDVEYTTLDPDIYHKNLKRVTYVIGDVAGVEESPVYAILKMDRVLNKLHASNGYKLAIYNAHPPDADPTLLH